MAQEEIRFHAVVHGRVQGVGFRYFVLENAQKLGLTGWVRNLWNGDVEVIAEGLPSEIDIFSAALHKGPSLAYVNKVDIEKSAASGEFSTFQARATH